jgi:hypothetical protein
VLGLDARRIQFTPGRRRNRYQLGIGFWAAALMLRKFIQFLTELSCRPGAESLRRLAVARRTEKTQKLRIFRTMNRGHLRREDSHEILRVDRAAD